MSSCIKYIKEVRYKFCELHRLTPRLRFYTQLHIFRAFEHFNPTICIRLFVLFAARVLFSLRRNFFPTRAQKNEKIVDTYSSIFNSFLSLFMYTYSHTISTHQTANNTQLQPTNRTFSSNQATRKSTHERSHTSLSFAKKNKRKSS